MGFISGHLLNTTRDEMVPGWRSEHLQTATGLEKALATIAGLRFGPRGAVDRYTYNLSGDTAKLYETGLDKHELTTNDASKSFAAQWNLMVDDVVIDGVLLKQNTGYTVDQMVMNDEVPDAMMSEAMLNTLYNYVNVKTGDGIRSCFNSFGKSIWGVPLLQSGVLVKETILDLMNHEDDWNGRSPGDLGTWQVGHSWEDGAPGTRLPDSYKKLVNVPQLFGPSAAADISLELVHKTHSAVAAIWGGDGSVWLQPASNGHFNTLRESILNKNSTFATYYQVPFGRVAAMTIEVIRIGSLFIYQEPKAEAEADAGRSHVFNIGMPNGGIEANRMAGLRVIFWSGDRDNNQMMGEYNNAMNAMATRSYPESVILSEASMALGGSNYWLPITMSKMMKAQGRVDTAYMNSYLDFRLEGERYKNYGYENLN